MDQIQQCAADKSQTLTPINPTDRANNLNGPQEVENRRDNSHARTGTDSPAPPWDFWDASWDRILGLCVLVPWNLSPHCLVFKSLDQQSQDILCQTDLNYLLAVSIEDLERMLSVYEDKDKESVTHKKKQN